MNHGNDPMNSERARPDRYLTVGRVVRPHGVRGALLVEPVSDRIRSIQAGMDILLSEGEETYTVIDLHPHKQRYLVKLESCRDREQAEQLRGAQLLVALHDLPPLEEGVYYYWQILDMNVHTVDGEELGQVVEIIETGANDVYVVKTPAGGELLLPAIKDVIQNVDLDEKVITVELLPGLDPT